MPELSAHVFVEGASDAAALDELLSAFDLVGVRVEILGGATNIAHALSECRATANAVWALCDIAESAFFERAFDNHGVARARLFHCDPDLEGEFISSLGVESVTELIRAEGESRQWESFRQEPQQRARPVEQQLHRFFGTTSGRKLHYGFALAERARTKHAVPRVLSTLMDSIKDTIRPQGEPH
ncbi:hypothetical protein [Haematomicrobium sanguinis]|uniref:hypothetical protein n=1 Tax=Haematomicrobium sanguinis TaxID=479106 RepID=UPI0006918D42|nr:hypothetical protein [Haematomicrobium sanguinis]